MRLSFFLFLFPFIYADPCRSNFLYQTDLNLCLLWMNDTALPMTASRAHCNTMGGDLLSIHNAFQNGLAAKFQNDRGWLGARRNPDTQQWSWLDGSPFDYQRFQSQGDPGSCAYLDPADQLWKIVDCDQVQLPALCAAQPVSNPLVCKAVDNQPLYNCLPGWQYSQQTGHSYLVIFDMTLTAGETYCQSLGGHLASIHSDAENDFVTNLCCKSGCTMYGDFYLGAYLIGGIKVNGKMAWTDESAYDYAHPVCYEINDDEAAVIVTNHNDCGYGCYPGSWLIARPFTIDTFPYLVCKK